MNKIISLFFSAILVLVSGNVLAASTHMKIISQSTSSMSDSDIKIWNFEVFKVEGYTIHFIANDQRNENMEGFVEIKADVDSGPVEISVSGIDKSGCNKAILTSGNSIRCVVGLLPNANSGHTTFAVISWNKTPNSKGFHGTYQSKWL